MGGSFPTVCMFLGRVSLGLWKSSDGGDPSNLAAEAAVRAVAAAGRRTGRVGDLGRGLLNGCFGDVLSGLSTSLAAELPDDGADFDGFDGAAGVGFVVAGARLFCFLMSLASSFFGSLEGADFGDAFLGVCTLPDSVALVGVCGPGEVVFWILLFDVLVILEAAGGATGCVSTRAGRGALLGLLSGVFGVCEEPGGEAAFGAAGPLEGADLALGWAATFGDCVSADFPLTLEFIGALVCFLGDCDGATAGLAFKDPGGLAFFALSFSNGDPFSMDPSSGVSFPRTAPPDTVPASLESEGSSFAVSASVVGTDLSRLVSDRPSVAPSLVLANFGPSGLGLFVESGPKVEASAEAACSEPPLG